MGATKRNGPLKVNNEIKKQKVDPNIFIVAGLSGSGMKINIFILDYNIIYQYGNKKSVTHVGLTDF